MCLVMLVTLLPVHALATDELPVGEPVQQEETAVQEHLHSWVYTLQDNIITATCGDTEFCAEQANLTLQQGAVEAGQTYVPFDAEELAQFNELTDNAVTEEAVVYYTDLTNGVKTTADNGAAAEGAVPTVEGVYFAMLTLGELIASAEFTLLPLVETAETEGSEVMTVLYYKSGSDAYHFKGLYNEFGDGWSAAIGASAGDRVVITAGTDFTTDVLKLQTVTEERK